MHDYAGHLAALATSVAWSATSVMFAIASRKTSSPIVNRTRLLMALIFVSIIHLAIYGRWASLDAGITRWGWLALSALIGYVIGDGFLFQAFVLVGPRIGMLLMALAPVFSTVMGLLFFHEQLTTTEFSGIALALLGVAMVVTGKRTPELSAGQQSPGSEKKYVIGILFGVGAAMGQAGGLVASRIGISGNFPALSGNLMRLISGTVIIWFFTAVQGKIRSNFTTLKANPRAVAALTAGAIFGPTIGVWLSLISIKFAPLGIASTLMSLAPVILIPVSRIVFKEPITLTAVAGTLMAVAGTALIFI